MGEIEEEIEEEMGEMEEMGANEANEANEAISGSSSLPVWVGRLPLAPHPQEKSAASLCLRLGCSRVRTEGEPLSLPSLLEYN